MDPCWVRRPAAATAPADADEEEEQAEDAEDDFDDETKWLIFHPTLTVLLPLAPPPGRRAKVHEPQVWLGFLNVSGGVKDADDDEMLTLVQALEYA
jgi:hypothetical protein